MIRRTAGRYAATARRCGAIVAALSGLLSAAAGHAAATPTPVSPLTLVSPPTSIAPSCAEQGGDLLSQPEDPAAFEAWLMPLVGCEMAAAHVPGVMLAVVKDDHVLLSRGFGVANIESGRAVSPSSSLFRIASVTKTFTATAIMQLIERGSLTLDSDVRKLIDFPLRLSSDQPILVRDLLTHRGGFESGLFGVLTERPLSMPALREVLAVTMPSQVRPPGTHSAYSNHGFTLLAYVAERATGKPFADYLKENVFDPLGMAHSTFAQPVPRDLAGDLVTEYEWKEGRLVPHSFETVLAAGGGAVSSTSDDMARFMLAQLNLGSLDGQRILGEESVRRMHAVNFSYAPDAGGMGYGFPHMTYRGHDVLWHTGALYYSSSRLSLIPDARIGIFIAVNSDDGGDLIDHLTLKIMNRYLPVSTVAAVPAPPQQLEAYAGYYRLSGTPMTTFAAWKSLSGMAKVSAAGGVLHIERNGRVADYMPSGKDRFSAKVPDPMLGDAVFFRDSSGAIAGYSPENRATSCMERVTAALRTPRVAQTLLTLVGAGMAAALLVVLAGLVRRHPASSTELIARWLVAISAAGFFALLASWPMIVAAVENDSSFVSWWLRSYLAATTALGVLSGAAALAVARTIIKGNLPRSVRCLRALWCLVALLQIGMLGYWNLLGFHYY